MMGSRERIFVMACKCCGAMSQNLGGVIARACKCSFNYCELCCYCMDHCGCSKKMLADLADYDAKRELFIGQLREANKKNINPRQVIFNS